MRGFALAGGMGLALACDLVVASDDAVFGTPEIDVGLWPYMITVPLVRSMPPKKALELMMTGRRVGAAEGERIGFVTQVVGPDELDAAVDQLATTLAAKSPAVLHLGRQAFYDVLDRSGRRRPAAAARHAHRHDRHRGRGRGHRRLRREAPARLEGTMIHVDQQGPVTLLTIDRQERRNALDHEALEQLLAGLAAAHAAASRVLVLTGAGGHFCAGADLTTVEDGAFLDLLHELLDGIRTAPFPSIAAIDGAALGLGSQLAVACDLRVATRHRHLRRAGRQARPDDRSVDDAATGRVRRPGPGPGHVPGRRDLHRGRRPPSRLRAAPGRARSAARRDARPGPPPSPPWPRSPSPASRSG